MTGADTAAPRALDPARVSGSATEASGIAAAPFYLLAFLSGAAALVYEVTWAKMLALTFGSTTFSTAAVVAGFMGGMGLGAWLYHLAAARVRRPLLLYAALEIGIAATAAGLTLTFYDLPGLFARNAGLLPDGPVTDAVRFVAVLLLLLVPAVLMGATFPALCMVMIRTARGVDRHLGAIYGVNTIGAAVGVLVAGLFLIERLGLTGSVRVANAVNVLVALGALALLPSALGRGDARSAPPEARAIPTTLPRAVTGVVLLVSGFCTLAYEILWFRALRYVTGTSTYAFTIVLFVFLLGLGAGSLLLRRAARRAAPERDLALCQMAIAVLALGAMAGQLLLLALPEVHARISIFSGTVRASPWGWRLAIDAGVAIVTMLPATIFMGLSFPLATRLFLGDVRELDTRVGTAYLLANVGSILGAIAGAAVLLPLAGTLGGTKVCAVANLALAAFVLALLRDRRAGTVRLAVGSAVLVAGLLVALPGSVRFRAEMLDDAVAGQVVFTEEGDLATVQVLSDPADASRRAMTIDGYKIGWSDGFEGSIFYRKQVLLAHLPMVLHPRTRHVLNVGLGSAATLQALAAYPQLETIDCVEISGAVVRGSRLFPESAAMEDPRARVVVDDAVHFLLATDRTYDLIVSDGKQDAFYSGNAVLLCREFYEFARSRLAEDGLLVQWIPLGTLRADFGTIARTFGDVFAHVDVFFFPPESILMVGGNHPLASRPRLTPEAYAAGPAGRDLATYFLPTASSCLAHWVAGREQLLEVLEDGSRSTWDRLVLDFSPFKASSADWAAAAPANLELLLRAEERSGLGAGPAFVPADAADRRAARLLRHAHLALFRGDLPRAAALAEQAVLANPDDGSARFFRDGLPSERN